MLFSDNNSNRIDVDSFLLVPDSMSFIQSRSCFEQAITLSSEYNVYDDKMDSKIDGSTSIALVSLLWNNIRTLSEAETVYGDVCIQLDQLQTKFDMLIAVFSKHIC